MQITIDQNGISLRRFFFISLIFFCSLKGEEELTGLSWLMDFGVGLTFPGSRESRFLERAKQRAGTELVGWDNHITVGAFLNQGVLFLKRYYSGLGIAWLPQPIEIGKSASNERMEIKSMEVKRWHMPIYSDFQFFLRPHTSRVIPVVGLHIGLSLEKNQIKFFNHNNDGTKTLANIRFSRFGNPSLYLAPLLKLMVDINKKSTVYVQYLHAFHLINRSLQYPTLGIGFNYLLQFKGKMQEKEENLDEELAEPTERKEELVEPTERKERLIEPTERKERLIEPTERKKVKIDLTDSKGKAISGKITLRTRDEAGNVLTEEEQEISGSGEIEIFTDEKIAIEASTEHHIPKEITIDQNAIPETLPLELEKIETNKSFIIDNIYFEFGKADLKKESINILDSLIEILKKNPHYHLEVRGHTDAIGDDDDNMVLSTKRTETVVDYMIKQGISPLRLDSKGYGETNPIASNETEQGRAKNRRTEFFFSLQKDIEKPNE